MDDTSPTWDLMGNSASFPTNQIAGGAPVFDVDGDRIGEVEQPDVYPDTLVVRKGPLFPHKLYIPRDAVADNDANGVYLRVSKDEIGSRGWDQKPSKSRAATTRATAGHSATRDGGRMGDDISVPVREETLVVDKQRGEVGHARVHKDVVDERQSVEVPVTREEMHVERVPVDQVGSNAAEPGPDAFTEQDIDVPLMGERVITEKRARVAEELRLRKQEVTEQRRVSDTVKRERVRVEGANVEGASVEGVRQDDTHGGDIPGGDIPIYEQDTIAGDHTDALARRDRQRP